MPKHRFGDFEIRDHAVLQRTNGDDVARRSAKHAFRVIPDGENLVGPRFDSDDRGFAQNDAVVFDVYESVSCAEIDADVIRKQVSKKLFEHD